MASLTKDLPPLPPPPPDPPEDPHKSSTGVFRRLTSRLRSPSQSWVHVSSSQPTPDELGCVQEGPSLTKKEKEKEKHKRKVSTPLLPHAHRRAGGGGVDLENAFTSAEQRQAALRAVGLIPANAKPGRDAHGYKVPLSEQEAQLDRQFAVTPHGDAGTGEPESEAQKIKEAWLKKNSATEPAAGGAEGSSGSASGGSGPKASSRSPERTRTQTRLSPEPRREPTAVPAVEERQTVAVAQPQGLMTAEQIRARRKDDPVFAPSGLLAAMQAYRPENYRPPPGRKPSGASAMQQQRRGDADTDSDASH